MRTANRTSFFEKARRIYENGVPFGGYQPAHVQTWPGSRVLRLGQPNIGNPLNELTIAAYQRRIKKMLTNDVVCVVGIGSASTQLFSHGIDEMTEKNLKAVNSFKSDLFNYFNGQHVKNLVTMYEGDVSNAGYSAFAVRGWPRFAVGTSTTRFALKGLRDGRYPFGGGFFADLEDRGTAKAWHRYLAISEKTLNAVDMKRLGLLDHALPSNCDDPIFTAVGKTFRDSDPMYQQQPVNVFNNGVLEEVLEKLDYDFEEDRANMKKAADQEIEKNEAEEAAELAAIMKAAGKTEKIDPEDDDISEVSPEKQREYLRFMAGAYQDPNLSRDIFSRQLDFGHLPNDITFRELLPESYGKILDHTRRKKNMQTSNFPKKVEELGVEDIQFAVDYYFSRQTPKDTMTQLEADLKKLDSNPTHPLKGWIALTLNQMTSFPQEILNDWYKFTAVSEKFLSEVTKPQEFDFERTAMKVEENYLTVMKEKQGQLFALGDIKNKTP